MKIEHEIEVAKPLPMVWDFFQDIPSVVQCMPGAELTEDKGDGVYAGKISVKLGPLSANFDGEATIAPDPEARSATITGKGVDRRGGSRGRMTVEYQLGETEGGTGVRIEANVSLAGAVAQFEAARVPRGRHGGAHQAPVAGGGGAHPHPGRHRYAGPLAFL